MTFLLTRFIPSKHFPDEFMVYEVVHNLSCDYVVIFFLIIKFFQIGKR